MRPVNRRNGAQENGLYTNHEEVRAYIEVLRTYGVSSREERRFLDRRTKNVVLQEQAPRLRRLMRPGLSELHHYEDLVARFGSGSGVAQNFRKRQIQNAAFLSEVDAVDARVRETECAEYERLVRKFGIGSALVLRFRRRKWQAPECQTLADKIDRRLAVKTGRRPLVSAPKGPA